MRHRQLAQEIANGNKRLEVGIDEDVARVGIYFAESMSGYGW